MRATDLYHTGLVVDDVDDARAALSELAGYRWGPTVGGDTPVVTPDGEITVPMRIAYSVDEPRLELVQTIPGTIWVPPEAGVHHLGYWSDDVEADVARLVAHGLSLEVSAPSPEGASLWAYCRGAQGPRIELVSRSMEPVLRPLMSAAAP